MLVLHQYAKKVHNAYLSHLVPLISGNFVVGVCLNTTNPYNSCHLLEASKFSGGACPTTIFQSALDCLGTDTAVYLGKPLFCWSFSVLKSYAGLLPNSYHYTTWSHGLPQQKKLVHLRFQLVEVQGCPRMRKL